METLDKVKYTPGPWKCFAATVLERDGTEGYWYLVEAEGMCMSLANAQLIAAAPELLEALEVLLLCFSPADENGFAVKQAREAIAKAKGQ